MGPSKGPLVLLLLVTTRSIRSSGLYPIRRQDSGQFVNSNREVMMQGMIVSLGKFFWLMLRILCEPVSLGMAFDVFDLPLTLSEIQTFMGMP